MAARCLSEDRGQLTKGHLSDFALANAQFLANRDDLDLIVYQTAAKERIRWLSARLAQAECGVASGPQISDAWIAERWPNQDPAEVRRRFDVLMDKLGETPWRGIPRFPEVMQPVLAWAAMLPAERIEVLTAALAEVPEHFRDYLYVASRPAFGEQSVKYQNVAGDNGHGMGKQAVAVAPYVKGYNIAPWIAAASPGNVGALLAELDRLTRALGEADAALEGIVSRATRTYRARNGRQVSIEADDGEACLIVHSDEFSMAERALEIIRAALVAHEQKGEA